MNAEPRFRIVCCCIISNQHAVLGTHITTTLSTGARLVLQPLAIESEA